MRKISLIQLFATGIPSLLIIIIVLIVKEKYNVEIIWMTRDVSVLGNIHPFAGFVSSLGILLWAITGGICLFTGIILKKSKKKDNFWFFLYAALLSFYLLMDDLFTLHEHSDRIFIGGEYFIYAVLMITVTIFLIYFKSTILKSNYIMLLLALFFLSSSILVDTIQPYLWEKGEFHALLEDGSKWLGISCWCSYFVNTAYKNLFLFSISSNKVE